MGIRRVDRGRSRFASFLLAFFLTGSSLGFPLCLYPLLIPLSFSPHLSAPPFLFSRILFKEETHVFLMAKLQSGSEWDGLNVSNWFWSQKFWDPAHGDSPLKIFQGSFSPFHSFIRQMFVENLLPGAGLSSFSTVVWLTLFLVQLSPARSE